MSPSTWWNYGQLADIIKNNFVTTGGPSSSFNHYDLIMSNQNLKRLSSKDSGNGNTKTNFHSSYYTQATAPMTNPKKLKEKIIRQIPHGMPQLLPAVQLR
jgi:hypothetical protein